MQVRRRNKLTAVIGIIGVGHRTYWDQFPGLLDILKDKQEFLHQKIRKLDPDIKTVDFGLVDESQSAYQALEEIRKHPIDMLFIDMLTYATSSVYAPLVKNLDIPMVLIALQPGQAMDYQNGSTFLQLQNDDICSVPEFMQVAVTLGKKPPEIIIGYLDGDEAADRELASWCSTAKVIHDLTHARFGVMGHVLECMYDMYIDPSVVTRTFGCHVVQTEPDDVLKHYKQVSDKEIEDMSSRILEFFDAPDPKSDPVTERLTRKDLTTAGKAAVALDKFIEEKNLDGLAYYYEAEEGSLMRELVANFIVGNSLLCAEGFPMCGEYDLKTCIAMMIMDRLDIGGSFAEFHPIDFERGTVLVGHDGPHHLNIAEGKPVLRSLRVYHGKPGAGASVEFNIKEGPITMLSIALTDTYKLKFVLAEGTSVSGPIPPTGNTNTHGLFKPDVRTFLKRWMKEGPTHHFALGIGHHAQAIQRIADIFGIESVIVTPEQQESGSSE